MYHGKVYFTGLQHFTHTTDHWPLIVILNHYMLDAHVHHCVVYKQDLVPDAPCPAPVSYQTSVDDDRNLQELHAVASQNQDYHRLLEYITIWFPPTATAYMHLSSRTGSYGTASMQTESSPHRRPCCTLPLHLDSPP